MTPPIWASPANGAGPGVECSANGVGPQLHRSGSITSSPPAFSSDDGRRKKDPKSESASEAAAMGVMEKLKIFVVKEPVVAASCLIAGFGLFLPAVVRPILDSWETAEKVPPPPLNEVVAGVTGKKN